MKVVLVRCNREEGEGVDIQEAIEMGKRGLEGKQRVFEDVQTEPCLWFKDVLLNCAVRDD